MKSYQTRCNCPFPFLIFPKSLFLQGPLKPLWSFWIQINYWCRSGVFIFNFAALTQIALTSFHRDFKHVNSSWVIAVIESELYLPSVLLWGIHFPYHKILLLPANRLVCLKRNPWCKSQINCYSRKKLLTTKSVK